MDKIIYDTLIGQDFNDWFNGDFELYISGGPGNKDKNDILQDIKDIFHLEQGE